MKLSRSLLTVAVSLLLFQLAAAAGNICHSIPGLPGRDGRDGKDGTPGIPGTPGALELSATAYQELRERLTNEIRSNLEMGITNLSNVNLSQLEAEIQNLKVNLSYLSNVVEVLEQNLTAKGAMTTGTCTQSLKAASSCKEIYACNPDSPSGFYWRDSSPPEMMYCGMNLTHCGDVTGGWTRVAHFNMTNPEGTCPSPLETISSPQSCSRNGGAGCSSVRYSTLGVPFTRVCGRAVGYQYGSTDAFLGTQLNIDDVYVDGLSITYDSPRRHLWTYASGLFESNLHTSNCPCNHGNQPPSYVGGHYYCESGTNSPSTRWYPDDPLWDGEGCPIGNPCCDPPNLPWFNRQIEQPSTADIELRLCQNEVASSEDVGLELFELYVY